MTLESLISPFLSKRYGGMGRRVLTGHFKLVIPSPPLSHIFLFCGHFFKIYKSSPFCREFWIAPRLPFLPLVCLQGGNIVVIVVPVSLWKTEKTGFPQGSQDLIQGTIDRLPHGHSSPSRSADELCSFLVYEE